MSDVLPQSGDPGRDWFRDVIKRFDSPSETDRIELAAKAVGIWVGYPLFREAIECLSNATDEQKYELLNSLNHARFLATEFLMVEAERVGLNPTPLAEEH